MSGVRLPVVGTLLRKEILSTLRDRRALVSTLLLPLLLIPLLMVGFPLLFGGLAERESSAVSRVGVQGEVPPALFALLGEAGVELVPSADLRGAVEADEFAGALALPEGFAARLEAGESAQVQLYAKVGNLRSELVTSKLRGALERYRQALVGERLERAGLSAELLEPFALETVDASSEQERGAGFLGWLIPYFIAIFTLTGGQTTAIDATAGEKERGTLESLLVAPVGRLEVVLGKAAATLLFGLAASLVGILSYLLSGYLLGRLGGGELTAGLGGSLSFDPEALLVLLVSSLLMAALVASLLVGIAMTARSFKQAQSYLAPLSFVMILPGLLLQFADFFALSPWLYALPVFNILLLLNDAVRGQALAPQILLTWGSSLLYAGLCLLLAYRNFQREDVLFRS